MAYQYNPPAIRATAESVDAQFDNAIERHKRALKQLKKARKVWEDQGKADLAAHGSIQQATCAAGAPYFALVHRNSQAAIQQESALHATLSILMAENVNEGNKCFP